MRILIYGINYPPEQIATGKYTGEMAAWLAGQNHSVRVVTAHPYYPQWRVLEGYKAWQYRRESIDGVDVWRCPIWVPHAPSGMSRIVHLLSFTCSSFPAMLMQLLWRPDIVLVIEPPLFCAPQAWFTARLCGAKAWLHVQDFEVSAFFGLGFMSSGVFQKCVVACEGWLMRRFDHVSSISKAMVDRVIRLRVPEQNTSLFPNWVDTEYIRPDSGGRDLRSSWGFTDEQKIILYAGNIGKKQGLEMMLAVAVSLSKTHPHAVFLLVGEGAAKEQLVSEAQARGLTNMVFKPVQPLKDLPALLSLADLHLVIQKRGAADAVMPSKLTGILAAGGFSIITADEHTELGQLVCSNPGIAVLVEPENANALATAIVDFLDHGKTVRQHNTVARNYAEQHLSSTTVLRKLNDKISDLTGNSERT